MTEKICPMLTNIAKNKYVFCNEDGSMTIRESEYEEDAFLLSCAGWKNGKCGFMRD